MADLKPEEIKGRLQKALDMGYNLYSPEHLLEAVKEGRMQCFQKGQTILLTEILKFPNGSVLNIYLAFGKLDDVTDTLPKVYEFAKAEGCKLVHMSGRKGWERILKKSGWKSEKVSMTKEL